jgi:hypothetical protein
MSDFALRLNGTSLEASVGSQAFVGVTQPYGQRDAASVGISPANSGTQNSDAFDAWMLSLTNEYGAANGDAVTGAEGGELLFGKGQYNFARTLYVRRNVRLTGISGYSRNGGTNFKFPAGVVGCLICGFRLLGDRNGSVSRGDYSIIRSINFQGTTGGVSTGHGILMLARATVQNCDVSYFSGHGIYIASNYAWPLYTGGATATTDGTTAVVMSTPAHGLLVGDYVTIDAAAVQVVAVAGADVTMSGSIPAGVDLSVAYTVSTENANCFKLIDNVVGSNGGHGIYIDGADTNAGYCFGNDTSSNGGIGLYDSSFLGNTHIAHHADANAGGSYKADDPNARSLFLGCYHEGGQPLANLSGSNSAWIGGLHDAGRIVGGANFVDGIWSMLIARAAGNNADSNNSTVSLGSGSQEAYQAYIRYNHRFGGSLIDQFDAAKRKWQVIGASETIFADSVAGYGAVDDLGRTLYNGTRQFSSATGFFLGNNRVDNSSLDPSSAAGTNYRTWCAGDVRFRTNPSPGESLGWVCTARGTSGSYAEGRTADSNGSAYLRLPAVSAVLRAGDCIVVAGVTTRIVKTPDRQNAGADGGGFFGYRQGLRATASGTTLQTLSGSNSELAVGMYLLIGEIAVRVVAVSDTSLTTDISLAVGVDLSVAYDPCMIQVADPVPAATASSIAYAPATFAEFGKIAGIAADASATPGNATQNTRSGRVAISAGSSSITVTNSKCTAASLVAPVLQTAGDTLNIVIATPADGAFLLSGNANATGDVVVAWEIR